MTMKKLYIKVTGTLFLEDNEKAMRASSCVTSSNGIHLLASCISLYFVHNLMLLYGCVSQGLGTTNFTNLIG